MKPAPFAYVAPRTVAEAQEILGKYGADARVIAGGQTLSPMLNMRIATPAVLVDINRIRDWGSTKPASRGNIITHALVRQWEGLQANGPLATVPLIALAMPYVGHFQTRNRGTICGSIAHGDPTAELPLVLTLLGGNIHLASTKRRRVISAADFFLGPLTTDRQPEELIVAVEWPILAGDIRFAFRKIGVHNTHSTLCSAAVAIQLDAKGKVSDLRVGLTAISDRPLVLDTKPFLNARPEAAWRRAIGEAARENLSFINDMHASADYRRHVSGILVERCIADIFIPREGE